MTLLRDVELLQQAPVELAVAHTQAVTAEAASSSAEMQARDHLCLALGRGTPISSTPPWRNSRCWPAPLDLPVRMREVAEAEGGSASA